MAYNQIIFSGHAIRQMVKREIARDDVLEVIDGGEIIIDYPDDTPYPSCLILGFVHENPIHVVCASDLENKIGIVVSAYIPDSELWTEDFKSRRTPK
jgi:hypothetical protein